jgi:hypothetical protein
MVAVGEGCLPVEGGTRDPPAEGGGMDLARMAEEPGEAGVVGGMAIGIRAAEETRVNRLLLHPSRRRNLAFLPL